MKTHTRTTLKVIVWCFMFLMSFNVMADLIKKEDEFKKENWPSLYVDEEENPSISIESLSSFYNFLQTHSGLKKPAIGLTPVNDIYVSWKTELGLKDYILHIQMLFYI